MGPRGGATGRRRPLRDVPAGSWAKVRPVAAILIALGLAGTAGFRAAFGSAWAQAVYETLVTMSTLGDSRIVPHAPFQYAVVAGVTLLGYASWTVLIAVVAGALVSMDLRSLWEGRRLAERIAALRGHLVVIGGGRVGHQVATELRRNGRTVVVVDRDPRRIAPLAQAGLLGLTRDAMDEGVLSEAGVERCAGVVLALPDDAHNLYVLFAVRDLAPTVPVVARAESVRAERHLRALGVDRVVLPTMVGGKRLARLITHPLSAEFLDTIVDESGMQVEERVVRAGEPLAGSTVRALRAELGERVTLLALRRADRIQTLPPADMVIAAGDTLLLARVHPAAEGPEV